MKSVFLLSIAALLFTAQSCKKDYLDKTPDDDLKIEQVFTNPVFTEQFLTNTYSHLPQEYVFPDNLTNMTNTFVGASDEQEQCYEPSFSNRMNDGTWTPSSYAQDGWGQHYQGIRKANVFLENIDKLPVSELVSQDKKDKWTGEALFLRAYYYFLLIRMYGPVPIIDKTIPLASEILDFKRTPIDQCVEFIVAECDKAAALLNAKTPVSDDSQFGRPTKASCLALKARVLLYMASPLWNGNPDYANFKDKEGVRLFPDADASRWAKAATAAKECIDQSESFGYKLYRSASNDPVLNYAEIFYVNWNDEVLWARTMGGYLDLDVYSEPKGMPGTGFTLNAPTQNIVDDYEMANGERAITGYNADMTPVINPLSGYVETGYSATETPFCVAGTRNMYIGREPRFYASIMFTGLKYKMNIRVPVNTPLQFWKGGLDGRNLNNSGNYSETGYLMRKLTNPAFTRSPNQGPRRTWVQFRLGEQYLNYAEALNEAQGPVGDVYKYVNLIRNRSGLPNLPLGLSKDQMREKIWHERRIELAFETHRYFDCHRWKIAEDIDNKNIYGLDTNTPGYTMQSDAFYVRKPVEKRVFGKKDYLWPMQQREIEKNQALVQNPGW